MAGASAIQRRVVLVLDQTLGENGVRYFYERFFAYCEQQRLSLLVIGDAADLASSYATVDYRRSERLPYDLVEWRGPHGLASRPFVASGAQPGDPAGLLGIWTELSERLGGMLAHGRLQELEGLDALADASWLDATSSELAHLFSAYGAERVYLPTQSFLGFASARALNNLPHIDVVHGVHTDYPGFFFERIMRAAAIVDRPRFSQLRMAMYQRITRNVLARAQRVLFPSAAAARAYGPHLGVGIRCDARALRGGVDAQRFRPRHARPRGDAFVVAYFGRLEHDKNAAALPEIARLSHRSCHWRVIGDGSLRGMLEANMPRAQFTGHLVGDALVRALQAADVCVLPSVHDTFALTVLEVMACGIPVIVTDSGGPSTYIRDGATGLVVAPHAGAFARAIELLRTSPSLASRLSAGGRAYAVSQPWSGVFAPLAARLFA